MSTFEAAGLAVLWTAVLAGLWKWRTWHLYRRRIPLSTFGREKVTDALRWETDARRQEVLERGWVTQIEWLQIHQRAVAAISDELRRRGVDPDNVR